MVAGLHCAWRLDDYSWWGSLHGLEVKGLLSLSVKLCCFVVAAAAWSQSVWQERGELYAVVVFVCA